MYYDRGISRPSFSTHLDILPTVDPALHSGLNLLALSIQLETAYVIFKLRLLNNISRRVLLRDLFPRRRMFLRRGLPPF